MHVSTLANWVFGIVGVIGLFLAIRWRPRKQRLQLTTDYISLIPQHDVPGGIEVRARGTKVENPYAVKAVFTNLGPGDISTADFEGGHIRLNVNLAKTVTIPEPVEGWSVKSGDIGEDRFLVVEGKLLKKGESREFTFLFDGLSGEKWDVRLPNVVAVTERVVTPALLQKSMFMLAFGAGLLTSAGVLFITGDLLTSLIEGLLWGQIKPGPLPSRYVPLLVGAFICGLAMMASGVLLARGVIRWRWK